MSTIRIVGHRYWLSVVFFLLASAPGFWLPALSNVMHACGLEALVAIAFMIPGLATMISPLIFAAQVDQRFHAEKVLGAILVIGAVFLYLAFLGLEKGWGGGWFLTLFAINALISAPSWSLLTMITLNNLPDRGRQFGLFRLWGTVGWMVAGVLVSLWALDTSPLTGQIAAGIRLVAGGLCLLLPPTPPGGKPAKSLPEALGFGALRLLKDRDQLVYFSAAFLFSIPLAAFYLHTPVQLKELGVTKISAMMASAQLLEALAMIFLGIIMTRFRIKTIFLIAMACGIFRYAFCATHEVFWLWFGIMLHGVCWTLFYEAGRIFINRRVEAGLRGQAQALLGLITSGFASILGVFVVKWLYAIFVANEGGGGWPAYWLVLTVISTVSFLLFTCLYRGAAVNGSQGEGAA